MLTNVFYYGVYQPYILRRQPGRQPGASGFHDVRDVLDRYLDNTAGRARVDIVKNNAMKRDVVDYAGSISKNVNEMRDCARYLAQNGEHYYVNVLNESFETAKQWAEEDASMFVNAFNATVSFAASQEHSPELKRYAQDLRDIAAEYGEELQNAGITVIEGSEDFGTSLGFSPDKINGMDYLDFGHAIAGAAQAATAVYDRTMELQRLPIVSHMGFRQLSYYYNYRVDTDARRKDTAVLHSGIILDRII